MGVRILRGAKSATQSGKARTLRWLLEFEPDEPRQIEPLMGWVSSGETKRQIHLWFPTAEAAVAYAERQGLTYRIEYDPPGLDRGEISSSLSYSDNFKPTRLEPWTH